MSQRDGVFVKQLGFARSPGISSLPGSVTGRLSPPSSSLMAWACRKEWDVLHRVFVSSKMCYFLTTTIYIPQSQKKVFISYVLKRKPGLTKIRLLFHYFIGEPAIVVKPTTNTDSHKVLILKKMDHPCCVYPFHSYPSKKKKRSSKNYTCSISTS